MNADHTQGDPTSGFTPFAQICRICDDFEQAWFSGAGPKIEDYLIQTPQLLRELLLHELEYRQRRGEVPTADEYKARFPGNERVIDRAFKEHLERAPTETASSALSETFKLDPKVNVSRGGQSDVRYSILAEHAKGGLGVVYRALDRELKREVALKEIQQRRAGDPANQVRFVFEAEVTGALEHPGIVPVYGLGRYADKRPYYAMRFIRGDSLKEAIKHFHDSKQKKAHQDPTEHQLQLRTLLRHFIDVCNAVQYAHSRGVLHRDLKPANVMLGKHGETLVVDWGLAKLLPKAERPTRIMGEPSVRPSSSSGSHTLRGSAIGTPHYMSPEQADGRHDELDPRTDVYSLGATLFSLLTGDHPVAGKTTKEVLQRVKRGDIRIARQANASVPRPLEAICRKAMSLERDDRYVKPRQLADDLERWLADEAVAAYKDQESSGERMSRWMRKHRSWTRAIAASLLVVAFVSSAAAFFIDRARQSELAAKEQSLIAKQEALDRFLDSRSAIDTWLTGASEALQYFPGTQGVRRRLLEKAVEDYEQLAETHSDDHDLEIERARTRLRLGDLHLQQVDYETAEKWYRSAASLFDELHDRFPDSLDARLGIANCTAKLGWLFTSMVRHPDAGVEFHEAIQQLQGLSATHPEEPRCRELLGTALLNWGHGLAQSGKLVESDAALRDAIAQFEQLEDSSSAMPRNVVGLSTAQELLGRNQAKRGDHESAIGQCSEAIASLDQLIRKFPDEPKYLDAQSEAYISRASSQGALGRFSDAEKALRRAAENYDALAQAMPDTPRYLENLALTLTDIGILLHDVGRSADAAQELHRPRDLFASLIVEYGSEPRFHNGLGACEDALGLALADLTGSAAQATTLLGQAVARFSELATAYEGEYEFVHRRAVARSHYAQGLHKTGDSELAASEFGAAIRILDNLVQLRPEVPEYREGLAHMHELSGVLHSDLGNADASMESFRKAVAHWQKLVDDYPTAKHMSELAMLLSNCPRMSIRLPEEAIRFAEQARDQAPTNPIYLNSLAVAHYRNGNFEKCVELLGEAIDLRPGGTANDFFFLAMAKQQLLDHGAAEDAFINGMKWMEINQPKNAELRRVHAEAAELLQPRQNGRDE